MRLPSLVAQVSRSLRLAATPARGETLLCALSGGPDSVALLSALGLLRGPRGFRLVAAHLDHRLRPQSAEDAAFCGELCSGLGVPLTVGAADVRSRALREKGGLEQAARRERYAFLRSVAEAEGASAIAVAHTRDDQAETLLLRLLRGSGATGLAGMRLRSGDLVRPLLGVSRDEVLAYLAERGLTWRQDPTNADPIHLRNRVRLELIPYLEARFNPGLRATLARTAGLLAEESAHLRREAEDLLGTSTWWEGRELLLARRKIAAAPPALARLALRQALARAGGLENVRLVHLERLLALARSAAPSGRGLVLPGGRGVSFGRDVIRIGPSDGRPGPPGERPGGRRP